MLLPMWVANFDRSQELEIQWETKHEDGLGKEWFESSCCGHPGVPKTWSVDTSNLTKTSVFCVSWVLNIPPIVFFWLRTKIRSIEVLTASLGFLPISPFGVLYRNEWRYRLDLGSNENFWEASAASGSDLRGTCGAIEINDWEIMVSSSPNTVTSGHFFWGKWKAFDKHYFQTDWGTNASKVRLLEVLSWVDSKVCRG